MDQKVLRTFRIPFDGMDDRILTVEETDAPDLVFINIVEGSDDDDGVDTETSIGLTRDQFDALMNLRYDVRFVPVPPADDETVVPF